MNFLTRNIVVLFSCREMVTSNYRLRARRGPSPVYTSNDIDEDVFVRKQDKTTEHVEEVCICLIVQTFSGFKARAFYYLIDN